MTEAFSTIICDLTLKAGRCIVSKNGRFVYSGLLKDFKLDEHDSVEIRMSEMDFARFATDAVLDGIGRDQ